LEFLPSRNPGTVEHLPRLDDLVDVKEVIDENSDAVTAAAAQAAKRFVVVDDIVHHSLHRPCWEIVDSQPDVSCHWDPYGFIGRLAPHRLKEALALSASFFGKTESDVDVRGRIEVMNADLVPEARLEEYVGDLQTPSEIRRYLGWVPRPIALRPSLGCG
jgi:hypothetical protein